MTTTYEAILEALEEEENQLTLYALGDLEEEQGNLVRAEAWRYLGKYKRRPNTEVGDDDELYWRWYRMTPRKDKPCRHDHPAFEGMSHWLPCDWSKRKNIDELSSLQSAYLKAVDEYERDR
jgi:hypothetical protein